MADDEQFSLCWNNFNSNLSAGFHESLCRGDLVDVTLAAEGQFVKAHRLVLSVCSPYFRKMFTQMPANQHAFVFLKDVSHSALKDLIQFMYCGEVNVKQEALPAFISTAEALQIKGLTDGDPAPPQTPPEPTTPTPQVQQMASSPRTRTRNSTSHSYKVETLDDSASEEAKPHTTQMIIHTAASNQGTTAIVHHTAPQQQHHLQTTQTQQIVTAAPATATTTVLSHKRPAQRNLGSAPHIKRTKSTIETIDTSDHHQTAVQQQQITVQTAVVTTDKGHQPAETEYIDLPIELPTKSEPEYAEEAGDVESGEQDGTYVEDDSYGDIRYDESYFTENEDTGPNVTSAPSVNSQSAAPTTSKALVKQQPGSFSDSSYVEAGNGQGDQTGGEAQDEKLSFIESPWATPCLVYNNYIYNCHSRKNNKEYWRCHNYSKKIQSERCRARLVLESGKLKTTSGGPHNHPEHTDKISKLMHRSLMVSQQQSQSELQIDEKPVIHSERSETNDDNYMPESKSWHKKPPFRTIMLPRPSNGKSNDHRSQPTQQSENQDRSDYQIMLLPN